MPRKEYRSERIVVSFDPERCIHARYCVRGLPEVFNPSNRPWMRPERARADHVAEVVMRCPTGALQFARTDGATAPIPQENAIAAVGINGPLYVRGDIQIKGPPSAVVDTQPTNLSAMVATLRWTGATTSESQLGLADE